MLALCCPVWPSLTSRANHACQSGRTPVWGKKHRSFPSNKQKEVQPIASNSHKDEFIRTERFQISCGRVIRVVSVFPKQGTETPADKLKALAELEFQQGKMCA